MADGAMTRCSQLESCALWRVLDVTRQMGAPIELDAILERVIEAALEVLDAERGSVFLYDEQHDELYSRVATGTGQIRFPADRGIAGQAARTRQLVNVPDCYADPRFNQEIDRLTGYRTRCLLTMPLVGIEDRLVGVLQVLNKRHGVFNVDDEQVARALAAQCAVALQRAMLIEEHLVKQKLERDLALARDIQLRVLPQSLPRLPGYEMAGWSQPAEETGGDIYDAVSLDDHRVALMLGDATGHGIGPALSVTQVRAMFRMGLRLGGDIQAVFRMVNQQLVEDLPGNRFVTAVLGLLDARRGELAYLAGGQGPLLHYHAAERRCQWLGASTIPLGILSEIDVSPPPPMRLEPGDIIGLLSDGIYEYADREGRQFGQERVEQVIDACRSASAQEMLEQLRRAVAEHADGAEQADDMTIVLIKRCP